MWLLVALMLIPSLMSAEPLITIDDLQAAAQDLWTIYASNDDKALAEKGLPIALRMKEMYQRTQNTEESPYRRQPSGEIVYTERAPLFTKAFFVICYFSALDPSRQQNWIGDDDCNELKFLAPDNHRSLILYASARLRAIWNDKLPRELNYIYPMINALNDALAIIESGQEDIPILPYRDIVGNANIYELRAYCYALLKRNHQALIDISAAKELGLENEGINRLERSLTSSQPVSTEPEASDSALLNYKQLKLRGLKSHLKHGNYHKAIIAFESPSMPLSYDERRSGLYDLSPDEEIEWYTMAGDAYFALKQYDKTITLYANIIGEYGAAGKDTTPFVEKQRPAIIARDRQKHEQWIATLWGIAGLASLGLLYIARRPLTRAIRAVKSERQARAFARAGERRQQQEIKQLQARDALGQMT
jgi:tetratricopeptide (TPR) repeat protein